MDNRCEILHKELRKLPRYSFPFEKKDIPNNGIYVLFQKGEIAHGGDRIVRIGTHTGINQLPSRLKQHFVNPNKDRSIFRKNIGRCLLNMRQDSYLEKWELDLTPAENKRKYSHLIDKAYQDTIEDEITKYIHEEFSFVIIPIETKEQRLLFEKRLISQISLCNKCTASSNWLGMYSPNHKIVESGLWQVNELYKEPFGNIEFDEFIKLVRRVIVKE